MAMVGLVNDQVVVMVSRRQNSLGRCNQCCQYATGYDQLKERRFKFIPLLGFKVEFVYTHCRVNCPEHGVLVEHIPWADGKSPICEPFKIFLAYWAKLLSWQGAAKHFQVTWQNVFESVEYVVGYGLKNRVGVCLRTKRTRRRPN